MSRFDKYVNAIFLAGAAIVWFVSRHYVDVIIGSFQLQRKWGAGATVLEHTLPIVLGVITFLALRLNQKSYNFISDAISELTKVSWPNKKEVQLGTTVVIITVIIAGILLGTLDLVLVKIVQSVISI